MISENTLNTALRRMGFQDRLTGHGIRGTLSTALNEADFEASWVEAQLSHADLNPVRAAYNHAAYVAQRRRMMQCWADLLDALECGLSESSLDAYISSWSNSRKSAFEVEPRTMPVEQRVAVPFVGLY